MAKESGLEGEGAADIQLLVDALQVDLHRGLGAAQRFRDGTPGEAAGAQHQHLGLGGSEPMPRGGGEGRGVGVGRLERREDHVQRDAQVFDGAHQKPGRRGAGPDALGELAAALRIERGRAIEGGAVGEEHLAAGVEEVRGAVEGREHVPKDGQDRALVRARSRHAFRPPTEVAT